MRKPEEKKIINTLKPIGERLIKAGFEFERFHTGRETAKQLRAGKLIKEAVELLMESWETETQYQQLGITETRFNKIAGVRSQ